MEAGRNRNSNNHKKFSSKTSKRQSLSPVLITAWLEKDRNNVVQTPGELKISMLLSGCFRRLLSELELHTSARKGMVSAD